MKYTLTVLILAAATSAAPATQGYAIRRGPEAYVIRRDEDYAIHRDRDYAIRRDKDYTIRRDEDYTIRRDEAAYAIHSENEAQSPLH